MSFAPGVRLGGYEIIGHLGSGGMGDVFRASDARLGRDVAIKVLPGTVANDTDRLRRFEIEARTVAALSHPNILSVFDTGVFEGSPYIVTELLEGETLRQKLDHGPVAPRHAIKWGLATARGLAAAHAKSIIHRYIKPENLLITKDGRLKILDFWLAKQLPAAPSTESQTTALLSSPGAVMGTPAYMSPEQVRGEALGAGSDLFSLGCVLYEMVTGCRPFRGDTSMDVMSAILREEPPEFTAQPPGLASIIRRCLEKDREARFHSAADLAFALEALSNPSVASSPDVSVSPVTRKSRAGIYGILVAASVLASMLAGWWWLSRRQSAVRTPVFERLTFQTGSIDRARFGADGKTFVYSADWRGLKSGVYSTVLGNPESRPLALPDGVRLASVSSTGELALLKGSVLSRARMDGTAPRDVATDIEDADWSPDGSQLAVIRNLHPGLQIEYPLGKTLAKVGWSPTIRVSPKGDRIALLRVNKGGDVISTLDLPIWITDRISVGKNARESRLVANHPRISKRRSNRSAPREQRRRCYLDLGSSRPVYRSCSRSDSEHARPVLLVSRWPRGLVYCKFRWHILRHPESGDVVRQRSGDISIPRHQRQSRFRDERWACFAAYPPPHTPVDGEYSGAGRGARPDMARCSGASRPVP